MNRMDRIFGIKPKVPLPEGFDLAHPAELI
jgi:hypothetical protein